MPQAVAAAAVWVGQVVGTAVGAGLTAIGVSGATALGVAGFAANAAYMIAEVAIFAGLNALIDDIANQKAAPQGGELTLRVAADVAREMVVGERPVAGSMVARYSYGQNVTQAHFVYQLADHPIEELSQVYGDGRLVRSSPLAHGTRTEITAYSYSGGARVWMTFYDGRPGQTANAWLVTKSATDPEVIAGAYPAWTTDHRGAGCAYVCIEVHWDSDILTAIPEFLFWVKGARLYDRRKDTTAGGSGSHRLNNPATWEFSKNAAVACDHYLLGYQVEDDELAFGIGLSPVEIPYATFAATADLCDEDVSTGVGGGAATIKRYEANAIISTAEAFETVLTNFQNQMAARIVDLGGRIGIIGAEERATPITLTDLDWAHDDAVRFADKLGFDGLYGAVVGSFPDPANMFQPTPYARVATSYLALADGGEATTAQLDLPYETNSRRAVRLATAWILRESIQPRLAGTFATRSLAYKLEPGDWFLMSSEKFQFENEKFEVVDCVKHDDFTITLTARAINPNFLAFDNDNDPDLSVPPAIAPYGLLMDLPTFTATASTIVAGGVVEPCIEVTLTSDEAIAREIVVEVGKWSGGVIVGPTMVDSYHAGQIVTKLRKAILPSTSYKVRMKTRAGIRESLWTEWSSAITTGSTYSVGSAGIADSIVGQAPAATDFTIATGATKNIVTHSSSAPSSPVNGDVWVDTSSTPNVIKVRVSGAWQTGGTVGAVYGSNLYETGGGSLATLANFKTALGIAASIASQGSLATLNSVAYGSGNVSGFGALAALSNALGLTAGGITGQGSLATLSSLAYGSGYLTGFNALAALNYVRLGGPTGDRAGLLNEASSAWMTNYDLITIAGIAAGFTGQGSLASLSSVGTSNITDNAVTGPAAAYTAAAGGQTAVGDGWVYEQTLTITATGKPIIIHAGLLASLDCDPSDAPCTRSVRVRRSGSTLYSAPDVARTNGGQTNTPFAVSIMDTPGAGSVTYTLESTKSGTTSVSDVSNRFISATEFKK